LKYLEQFVIPFSGLPDGDHWFDFEIETAFFECFENSDVLKANITLKLKFTKRSTMLELDFDFAGTIGVECDRCLGPVTLPIEWNEKLFVKFGNEEFDETAEILVIPYREPEIDISKLMFEMIYVALPMKRAHNQGECEEGIEERISVEEHNKGNETDPRWDQLKNL
jgi:uncharacterized metal-binding protein YceD (DUF177 family)